MPRPFFRDLPADRATLWALGDGADGTERARRLAAGLPPAHRLGAFLYLGDVYERGTAQEFERHYHALYGRLAAVTAPVPGNHEWGLRAEGYEPYWRRARGVPVPPWYAFRAGGWLVLCLNSEEPCGPGSPQHAWLRAELRGSSEPVIAAWHRPRLSAGEHGDQPDVAPLWEAVAGRAALVLSGHDHNLQRMHPVDGITQFVVGAGGRSSYVLTRSWRRHIPRRLPGRRLLVRRTFSDPRLAFGDDRTDGSLRLEVRPGRVAFAFVSAAGAVLDAGVLTAPAGTAAEPARVPAAARETG